MMLKNNIFSNAYKAYFKQIRAQYAPFAYSDIWSELGYEGIGNASFSITTSGPLSHLDLDMAERVQPWAKHEIDRQQEWGSHKGNKPDGSDFLKVKKICKKCKGRKYIAKKIRKNNVIKMVKSKCKTCKGFGYVYYKYRFTKTNPEIEGRLKQQYRYDGKGYWPHNRDVVRTPAEQPISWEEYSQKPMLGKPNN